MQPASPSQVVVGLEAIIDAAAGVLAEESLPATLRGMATALDAIVPFTSLAIYEVDRGADVLVPVFAVGRYVDETLASRPPIASSLAGAVVTTGQMVHLEPGDPRPMVYTIPDTPEDEKEAIVFVPLVVADGVIGTLNLWREGTAPSFAGAEAELIARFAKLAALAYANAQQREQLREQALTDELTGLANRRHFHVRLSAELAAQPAVSVVAFDLDDFKAINDRHGHPAGDAALRAFADALRGQARASDLVCRVGGEEFAVILLDAPKRAAEAFAKRALAATRRIAVAGEGHLTASAGVATAPTDAQSIDELLRIADGRLLRAKADGKNRVETNA
jgi:diguanylate cyclase (GGDEF)-like protein